MLPDDVSVNTESILTGREPSTLVDVLRMRADRNPHTLAYSFLGDAGDGDSGITYGDLDHRARTIAACLKGSGIASGARVLLLYPPGLEYVTAFLGCLYAGLVAVPAYPPRLSRPLDRLAVISSDSEATAALTNARILAKLDRRFENSPELRGLSWFATDAMTDETAGWDPPVTDMGDIAFLQYTSGSTAAPKGVMVTHGNLLHNSGAIYRGLGHTENSHMVSWLPPYHDMGLIGVIVQALYGGFPATLLPPGAFLQSPIRWLEAISATGADSAGGPNFAYELCVRKTTPEQRSMLDLSGWKVAFCGAEPVRAETLRRFASVFEPCGFDADALYPGYGLAEATLIVSGGRRGSGVRTLEVDAADLERGRVAATENVAGTSASRKTRTAVSCGRSVDGQRVVIVDPETCRRTPGATVGEIWVGGPSVAAGYWGRSEESDRVFDAYVSDSGDGPFLRTGDLGFLWDGELFVTGRLKDLVILRGRNHYPQDLEHSAELSHEALRSGACAAFTVETDDGPKLILAAELERRSVRSADPVEVAARVRGVLASEHELEVHAVALVRTGRIPVTSSGKIRRKETCRMYLGGELDLVAVDELSKAPDSSVGHSANGKVSTPVPSTVPDASPSPGVLSLVGSFAAKRGYTDAVELRTSVRGDLGLDSLALAELAVEFEAAFDVSLGETTLTEVETVGDLCALVDAASRGVRTSEAPAASMLDFRERVVRDIPQVGVVVEEQRGRDILVDGRWCVDFASANYLGLDLHPGVIAAIPEAIEKWGVHPSWTRAVASPKIYDDLEGQISDFIGAREVLVFPTITLLHAGVLPVLASGDGVILLDQSAHNSLQEAAQLARTRGTAVDWFDHNDPGSLEGQLIRYGRYSRKIIAIDGVYSMSGAYPPLTEFVRLARQHDAKLYVDDAHGFGVVGERPGSRNPYGSRGNGIVRHFGVDYADDITYVGGMSKAFSSMVAFVTCEDAAQKAKFAASSTAVFSGPTPIASLASASAGLRISDSGEGESLREHLLNMTRTLISGARDLGFRVDNDTDFPLVTVEVGTTPEVVRACRILWEHGGILITPAVFPAVPIDRGGLRFTLTSANTDRHVEMALDALRRVASHDEKSPSPGGRYSPQT